MSDFAKEDIDAEYTGIITEYDAKRWNGDIAWLLRTPSVLLLTTMTVWAGFSAFLKVMVLGLPEYITQDTVEALRELHFMLIAASAGALGAFVRVVVNLPSSLKKYFGDGNDLFHQRLQVSIGAIIGVATYWLVQSKFFVHMLYGKTPEIGEITRPGVAIAAALGGLLAKELVGRVTDRLTPSPGNSSGALRRGAGRQDASPSSRNIT